MRIGGLSAPPSRRNARASWAEPGRALERAGVPEGVQHADLDRAQPRAAGEDERDG